MSCECFDCRNHIRHMEGRIEDLETQLRDLKWELEREIDDRRAAVQSVTVSGLDLLS